MHNVVQIQPLRRAVAAHRDGARAAGSWEIERDVIRGRTFDRTTKFMPDGLSQAGRLEFLGDRERTLLSQIQGRTYANMFRLVERFIGANMLEVSRAYLLGEQETLEPLVAYTQEEIRHQQLFARIELMMAGAMAQGYRFEPRATDVTWLVLGRSRWSVLALTCMVELLTQAHYRESIAPDSSLSALYKDVFLFHWRDEERHTMITEREWRSENARLSAKERDCAVDDFLELVRTLDMLLQRQAAADAAYFFQTLKRALSPIQAGRVQTTIVRAYRWQYILSGVQHETFADVLADLVSEAHGARIAAALTPFAAEQTATMSADALVLA
jgi:hypothetical protein